VSSSVALLDVDVLVALFDPDRPHHEPAHVWFAANRDGRWATCPITENGVVRILSNAAYADPPLMPSEARDRLGTFCESGGHVFIPDDASIRQRSLLGLRGASHRQLTDVYLLGLARRHGGRLATFDRGIPLRSVAGANPGDLEVIPA
jgi:uncharacterized protein